MHEDYLMHTHNTLTVVHNNTRYKQRTNSNSQASNEIYLYGTFCKLCLSEELNNLIKQFERRR